MRWLAVIAIALVACSTPVATPSATPSATAVSVQPTAAPTRSIPAAMTVSGFVTWNHHPQMGVRVEVSQLGAPGRGPALGAGVTSIDGSFRVSFAPPTYPPSVGAFTIAHDVYLDAGRSARGLTDTNMDAGTIEIRRIITGLSIKNGDVYDAGPRTLTWDPVPEATAYCVNVWRVETGASGGNCPEFAHAAGELVTTTRFVTKPLDPGLYAVSVLAITDTVIGELDLRPPGIAFTVK
jgi:hypothetical protein